MIILRDKNFSEKKKSREELEKEYKEQSEKFQKKAAPGAGIGVAVPAAMAGVIAGGELGEHLTDKTKAAKKAKELWKKSGDRVYDGTNSRNKEAAKRALRVSAKAVNKIGDRGRATGIVVGGVGAGIAGYHLGKKAFKNGVKRGDKKFLAVASDEKVKESTDVIKNALEGKKKK